MNSGWKKLETSDTEHLSTVHIFTKTSMNGAIAKVSFWGTHLSSVARNAFCRQSWAGWVRLVAAAKEVCAEMITYLRLSILVGTVVWGVEDILNNTSQVEKASHRWLPGFEESADVLCVQSLCIWEVIAEPTMTDQLLSVGNRIFSNRRKTNSACLSWSLKCITGGSRILVGQVHKTLNCRAFHVFCSLYCMSADM